MQNEVTQFLFQNMQEMEIELRAQSITLDALGAGVVVVEDLQDALQMARGSDAMRDYVREKYRKLGEALPLAQQRSGADGLGELMESLPLSRYKH